ncbi:hypothetical protein L1280_001556 [Deinococcus sp. HSC-46F16]|uniref:hypothetical protein n=1 Tax=Deinococcus sp. HSC-46F16 TaxID=2910968 RepID=UPI0020A1D7BC|nr:hypothetical protein [Deinococcus sp. HSC-46F16]MCP2014405.1 hypothetical protein [Deinococcus sp. HSC-46F16]
MRNRLNLLTPVLAAAVLVSSALAAPGSANAGPRTTAPATAGQRTPTTQTQAPQVTYYRGDPLQGGQRLGTTSVTTPRGDLFQNAPAGATHAVVTTPTGQRVVALQDARNRPQAGQEHDGNRGTRDAQNGNADRTQRAAPSRDRAVEPRTGNQAAAPQPRSDLDVLSRALQGASRVTFYTADPLNGGRVIQSITLSGNAGAPQAALTQAAQAAKFAVVERNGTREVVDLSAAAAQPEQAAPRGPQRR